MFSQLSGTLRCPFTAKLHNSLEMGEILQDNVRRDSKIDETGELVDADLFQLTDQFKTTAWSSDQRRCPKITADSQLDQLFRINFLHCFVRGTSFAVLGDMLSQFGVRSKILCERFVGVESGDFVVSSDERVEHQRQFARCRIMTVRAQ